MGIMRGAAIIMVFFSMFVLASLLIPLPMFPGNVFCALLGVASEYFKYLSAIFNGVFYGIILGLIFVAISRRLGRENS
jgi:hypothetical protein